MLASTTVGKSLSLALDTIHEYYFKYCYILGHCLKESFPM